MAWQAMFNSKVFLETLTSKPGVYCMKDVKGHVLYVGKAKNLKKRVSSYFRLQTNNRLSALVEQIHNIEITVTGNEKEALLLENTLIKSLNPKYNIVFKDDKSYPYLFLSKHAFPRLISQRGPRPNQQGTRFGPYPNIEAVRYTLNLLQKLFKLRQCDDVFFQNRSRPCLQYQIKRCSAPCTGYISEADYAKEVESVSLFLSGKQQDIIQNKINVMTKASHDLDFEKAAQLRDQIAQLNKIVEQQAIEGQTTHHHIDCIVAQPHPVSATLVCVYILFIRDGKVMGGESFFPKIPTAPIESSSESMSEFLSEVVSQFVSQYYLIAQRDFPKDIIINTSIESEEQQLLTQSISQFAQKTIRLISHMNTPVRLQKARWLELALQNAKESLQQRVSSNLVILKRYEALEKVLGYTNPITRMECFDVSHTLGEHPVASCVVFDQNGPLKSDYRRFNLEVNTGDDYAALEEALMRHYKRLKKEGNILPSILIIDGGKGQLSVGQKVFKELQIIDVTLMGVAKGEGRKPGLETLYVIQPNDNEQQGIIHLQPTSAALHLIQAIRDEAHRFAISAHRKKRAKARRVSPLEEIYGLGPKRRQTLLNYFGGLQGLSSASLESITKVPGIGPDLANKIYAYLHGE